MRKVLRRVAFFVGGPVALVGVAIVVLFFLGGARLNRSYEVPAATVPVPDDTGSIARGRHLAEAVMLCTGCHGDDLGGDLLFEAPGIATLYAPNLTTGVGGKGSVYGDADWVRAIRHGVSPEGRGLMIMHADAYNGLGTEDLGAVIAYARSVPPVDKELPAPRVTAAGRVMIALGLFDSDAVPLIPAEVIDHEAPIPTAPRPGPSVEYGRYLVGLALCRMCHGPDLQGGLPIEEGAPPGPSLAPYGAGGWTAAEFLSTIRTGTTPYGKALNADHMPWIVYARMTDEELEAIHAYVASVTP